MILELTLLTGRFHATPWGRHVNEAIAEWPPSPFRLLRAALDAWYRKHPEIPSDVVTGLLAALAAPASFKLPRARSSHTRSYLSQNSEDPSDKKLVFDGFAVVDVGSKLLIGWPGVRVSEAELDAARKLFGSINYLGRSESWVELRVVEDHAVEWNCVPVAAGGVPTGKEVVSLAGVVTKDLFDARGFVVEAKKKTKARKLEWLEALGWGSAEAIDLKMNRPPALEPLFYLRDVDAVDARPAPSRAASSRVVEAVRFAVDARVRAPITDALTVGEQMHRNLMGSLRRVQGHDRLSPTISGRDADGNPAVGHSHVSFLPLDEDRDGFIDAVLLSSPTPLTAEEQRAVDQLRPLWRRSGHPLVLTPIQRGARDQLLRKVTRVRTQTPFAPPRFWRLKRDGDLYEWIAAQVRAECEQRGLPAPLEIRTVAVSPTGRRTRWLDFRRAHKDDAPRTAFGVQMTFPEPVATPFSLGYASHFGLGCFVADDDPPRSTG